ncbi:MAG: hypothetical protein BWX85_00593 [Chloroflexi bacterium ADurb.Bin120]|nr:MAG: hypothetical protein BWX85_00593 [Chloroflexi bacterium ADurb.Bin120]
MLFVMVMFALPALIPVLALTIVLLMTSVLTMVFLMALKFVLPMVFQYIKLLVIFTSCQDVTSIAEGPVLLAIRLALMVAAENITSITLPWADAVFPMN